ncbi:carboxypeptidase-like regulatory domain-containing protein [Catenuloplanes indicus]|uniref:Carboxypeptidase regulatory-like domain-containing protein n=1 Tax=Catenuloplanes indicus TaxID=137267 RepID=A0AAE4AX22_9ACTN|nr:carboxypeptidase-like regulatory domain-containing protein [Catenuloplanes indicus]MDQ0365702.1 hypothetical protein [Catenuloplanes indicus]
MRHGIVIILMTALLTAGCGGDAAPGSGPDTPVDSSMTPPPANAGDTGVVAGTVTTADGTPLAGAALLPRALDVPGGADIREEVIATDGTGAYRWPGLSPGRYEFRVRYGASLVGEPSEATVEAGQTTILDFVLPL